MDDRTDPTSRTRARTRKRRARMVRWLAVSIVAALLAAGGAIVFQTTSDKTPSAATSVLGVQRHASPSSPARAASTPTASARATARAKTTKCLNSFDRSCGTFYWSPKPGSNAALSTTVSPSASSTSVGQSVTLIADSLDPDAPINCHWVLWGDETSALIPSVFARARYGRWVPPAKQRGTLHIGLTHTYKKAGTYHVQFGARSGDGCTENYNPYASETVTIVTVSVK